MECSSMISYHYLENQAHTEKREEKKPTKTKKNSKEEKPKAPISDTDPQKQEMILNEQNDPKPLMKKASKSIKTKPVRVNQAENDTTNRSKQTTTPNMEDQEELETKGSFDHLVDYNNSMYDDDHVDARSVDSDCTVVCWPKASETRLADGEETAREAQKVVKRNKGVESVSKVSTAIPSEKKKIILRLNQKQNEGEKAARLKNSKLSDSLNLGREIGKPMEVSKGIL